MRKVFFLCLFLVITSYGVLWAAFASIDKVKIRIDAKTGSTVAGVITLENKENKNISVKIYPMEWKYIKPFDGSKKFMPLGSSCERAQEWLQVYPQFVELAPGEKQSVHYKLQIPEDLTHPCYLVIFFETDVTGSNSISGKNRIGLQIFTRIGSLLLVEPEDISTRTVSIASVSRQGDSLNVDIENKGNTALIGTISAFVMDRDENLLYRTEKRGIYMPANINAVIPLKILGEAGNLSGYKAIITIQPEVGQPISVEMLLSRD